MAEFDIVDLTIDDPVPSRPGGQGGTGVGQTATVGGVDTTQIAAGIQSLQQDMAAHITTSPGGLTLAEIKFRLSVSAQGKVAFVAKGAMDASIEITLARVSPNEPAD